MEWDIHDPVCEVEGLFNSVSVVDIDIEVENTWVDFEKFEDCNYDIVNIAEAGVFSALGVVEAARPVYCYVRFLSY